MGKKVIKEPKVDMNRVITDDEYDAWERYIKYKYGRTKDEQFENIAMDYINKTNNAKKKYKDKLKMFEED